MVVVVVNAGDCDVVDSDNDGTVATADVSFDESSADDDNDVVEDDTSSDAMSTTMLK